MSVGVHTGSGRGDHRLRGLDRRRPLGAAVAAALTLLAAAPGAVGGGEASPAATPASAASQGAASGGQVRIDDNFWIDRYEYPNEVGRLPVVDVTWREAAGLCAARGQRLCTESEWERACRGPQGYLYGYGDRYEPERCNTPHPVGDRWVRGAGTAPSGTYPDCGNDNGVRDLIGNVWEWTDGWYDADRRWHVVRGGSWFHNANLARADRRYGHYLTEGYRLDLVGFRCCRSAGD